MSKVGGKTYLVEYVYAVDMEILPQKINYFENTFKIN